MKLWLASLMAIALAVTAWAQDKPKAEGPRIERVFKALDSNGDGKIDMDEMRAGLPGIVERMHNAPAGPAATPPPGPPRGQKAERPQSQRPGDGPPRVEKAERPQSSGRDGGLPPELERRIADLVQKNVREMLQRHGRVIAERVEQMVEQRVNAILAQKVGQFRKQGEMGPPAFARARMARERGADGDRRAFVPGRAPWCDRESPICAEAGRRFGPRVDAMRGFGKRGGDREGPMGPPWRERFNRGGEGRGGPWMAPGRERGGEREGPMGPPSGERFGRGGEGRGGPKMAPGRERGERPAAKADREKPRRDRDRDRGKARDKDDDDDDDE